MMKSEDSDIYMATNERNDLYEEKEGKNKENQKNMEEKMQK